MSSKIESSSSNLFLLLGSFMTQPLPISQGSYPNLHHCPPPAPQTAARRNMLQFLRLAIFTLTISLPRWLSGKESACQSRRCRRHSLDPWVGKIPWRRKWQPTTVPGKSHGQKRPAGYSPWGHKESDTTEHAHALHFYT